MSSDTCSYQAIVDEISGLTNLKQPLIEQKVWREALNPGVSVREDAFAFRVNFHVYDERMETLYTQGYGYVFDTMVGWCRRGRQEVLRIVCERIRRHSNVHGTVPINVLMLGDGCGNDTLFFATEFGSGINLYYCDIPGSKTFQFAQKRLEKRGICVQFVTPNESLPSNLFDVVVCLEVLEHLPRPEDTIAIIHGVLKLGGIALITESFEAVTPDYPTHLRSNFRFAGRTPFLFLRHKLTLTFFNTEPRLRFRPMEFTKRERVPTREELGIVTNRLVIRSLLSGIIRRLKAR